jgi:hypothetical protein
MQMKQVFATPDSTILLGRAGENLAREIVFDISLWRKLYGDGSVALLAQRPGENTPYPCNITIEGDTVYWPVTASDTAKHGAYGRCELQYVVDKIRVKSSVWRTYVADSLSDGNEDPSEPQQAWVDKVLEAAQKVNGAQIDVDSVRAQADKIQADVGDLTALKTSDKSSLVAAINEVRATGGGGGAIEVDGTLTFRDGVLSVNCAQAVEEDNTLPVTSAAVSMEIGNIEALLKAL